MTWGNPSAASFEKRHVRMVVVDHHRVKVHRTLAPIVERILLDLAEQGLTAQTDGWKPGDSGREFRIEVDGMDADRTAAALASYGFVRADREQWYVWHDSTPPEEPEEPETAPGGDDVPVRTKITKPLVPEAHRGTERLGERALKPGDKGSDVLTLQAFLGAPRTGVYDDETAEFVRAFHTRKGFQSDGSMPLASQCWIIPRTTERLRSGAAGLTVMLLSAALIAKGVLDLETPIRTRYSPDLAEVVRDYRQSLGLPRSEVVDSPTWASLVGQPRQP